MRARHLLIGLFPLAMAGIAFAASNIDVGTSGSSQGTVTIHGLGSGSAVIGTPSAAGSAVPFNVPAVLGSNGNFLQTDGAGNWTPALVPNHLETAWAPGMNLSGVAIPLFYTANGVTVNTAFCRVETGVGGTATVQLWYAAAGTALGSGTHIETTACNANGTAFALQTMGVTNGTVPAGNWIGVVFPTNAAWATSAGSGGIKITIQ
jgi:hypothetical protein